jgi:hypothetical protein
MIGDMMLCSIRVDDPAAKPEQIISWRWESEPGSSAYPNAYPCVSPDEKYVAYAVGSELKIVEISSGSVVTKWTAPGPEEGMFVRWSPDGKEVFLSGYHNSDLGLWSFDVESKEAWQIFDAPAIMGTLSPDRSRMTVEIRQPFGEIWLAKLDPNIPTYQALAPVLTREEFLRRRYEQYSRAIKSNALDQGSCFYATGLIDNFASLGMERYKAGAYEDALKTLISTDKMRTDANQPSAPEDVAFIAMSLLVLSIFIYVL